jgi:hypothetical protein
MSRGGAPSVRVRVGAAGALQWLRLCWLEVSVANGWFLLQTPRPVEAPMEAAVQLALSRGPCRGVLEAA